MPVEPRELPCLEHVCDDCRSQVAKVMLRHLCPSCGVGEFGTPPSGPKDTFVCSHCGAIVLPGKKFDAEVKS